MASIKDLKRMCEMREFCAGCLLCRDDKSCLPDSLPDNADEIIDKWVAEHPVKTYAMDFFEKFPNAQRDRFGAPMICMRRVYNINNPECGTIGCDKCWNRKMKENG